MKRAMVVMVMAVATTDVEAQDDYYFMKHTKRVFDGMSVELAPLVQWWQKSEAETARQAEVRRTNYALGKIRRFDAPKPLSAWVRVTGQFVELRAQGWVVDATIESEPGRTRSERILLKHPPEMEKAQFEALKQRASDLASYGSRMTSAAQGNEASSQANSERASRLREVADASTSMRTYNDMTRAASQYDSQAYASYDRAQRQRWDAAVAGMSLEQVRQSLSKFPPGSAYTIDYLALRKSETVASLPVYDLGLVAN